MKNQVLPFVSQRSSDVRSFLTSKPTGKQITFAELHSQLRRRIDVLRHAGIEPDRRIGVLIDEPLELALWILAGLAGGFWIAPLDPTSPGDRQRFLTERSALLKLDGVVFNGERVSGIDSVTFISADAEVATRGGDLDPSVSTGGIVLSSSGTTGTPKVMLLSTEQLLSTAANVARHNALSEDDRGFNSLPLWHINAIVVGLLSSLRSGAQLILDERFHRTGFWEYVAAEEVTWINAVPAIISRLLATRDGEARPTKLRFVRSASAPLSPAVLTRFESTFNVPVIESYGATEAASQICANPLTGPRKAGSVGIPVGVDVRLRPMEADADSRADFVTGEVEIRGASVISRYESAEYDSRFDHDGWLRMGDVGYFDEDGYLFLVGRTDDVINRGGEKIYPSEIENVVHEIHGVDSLAVVGENDEVFGQVPILYLRLHDNDISPVEDIVKKITDEIPRVRRPREIRVLSEFPTHSTGKIQKKQLHDALPTIIFRQEV